MEVEAAVLSSFRLCRDVELHERRKGWSYGGVGESVIANTVYY